jgi:hypothetical protein
MGRSVKTFFVTSFLSNKDQQKVTKGFKGISHEVIWECDTVPASLSSAPPLPKATRGRARKPVVGRIRSVASCRQTPKAFGVNFHEPVLKNGIFQMILTGANQKAENEDPEVSLRIRSTEKNEGNEEIQIKFKPLFPSLFSFGPRNPEGEVPLGCPATLLTPHPATAERTYSWLAPSTHANRYCAARLGILTGSLILGLGASLRHFG